MLKIVLKRKAFAVPIAPFFASLESSLARPDVIPAVALLPFVRGVSGQTRLTT
jgi:hypothetical protein